MTTIMAQTHVIERVKLPVSDRNRPALRTFVQQWYADTFPLLPGFQQATFSDELGSLIIEAQWSNEDQMGCQGRDARLQEYFSGLHHWFTGWPDISVQRC